MFLCYLDQYYIFLNVFENIKNIKIFQSVERFWSVKVLRLIKNLDLHIVGIYCKKHLPNAVCPLIVVIQGFSHNQCIDASLHNGDKYRQHKLNQVRQVC